MFVKERFKLMLVSRKVLGHGRANIILEAILSMIKSLNTSNNNHGILAIGSTSV